MGPPSDASGNTTRWSVRRASRRATVGQWVCEHRDPYIRDMVGFRRVVAGTTIDDWWDNGANAIAFSRGDRGFVAINLEDVRGGGAASTPLAPGTYCDLLSGGSTPARCVGRRVEVDAAGPVHVDLDTGTAVAIHVGTRL